MHVHSTAIDEQIDRELDLQWDGMIRKTLDDGRLYLVYQPIVSLSGQAGKSYEVLLRVVDEKGRVILPGQFISLAERTGMSAQIDHWIIGSALKALRAQNVGNGELSFFVKISRATLSDAAFPAWLEQQLEEHQLRGSMVVFEIPQATAVQNRGAASAFIHSVSKLGCRIAIEHFGHVNSPDILDELGVDFLKIDGTLVEDLAYNAENQAMVRSVVEHARVANIRCIAERVDDASSLVTLWQYNVDYIQGNFVREPGKVPDYDFEEAVALHCLAEN